MENPSQSYGAERHICHQFYRVNNFPIMKDFHDKSQISAYFKHLRTSLKIAGSEDEWEVCLWLSNMQCTSVHI